MMWGIFFWIVLPEHVQADSVYYWPVRLRVPVRSECDRRKARTTLPAGAARPTPLNSVLATDVLLLLKPTVIGDDLHANQAC